MSSTVLDPPVTNPFVGPRSIQAGQPLFGRNRERHELLDTVLAHRIVLLYSPSGAGKTSLIQAGLVDALEARGILVPRQPPPAGGRAVDALPVLIRLGHDSSDVDPGRNRYIDRTVNALENALSPEMRADPADTPGDLTAYLDDWHLRHFGGGTVCLIFDQFEELLIDQSDAPAKREFLRQLGAFLGDQRPWPTADEQTSEASHARQRFALFSMREDFLAQLEPFLALIPTGLRARYRLNLLGVEAATIAIQRPVGDRVEFEDAAAAKVVEDLSTIHVTHNGRVEHHHGLYVEPVQLQVVCRQLWERRHAARVGGPVTVADVAELGSVDAALEDFYDEQVSVAASAAGLAERDVREWFNGLITDRDLRTAVSTRPRGDDGQAIESLLGGHIIRREETRGAAWFELSHDSLVTPVRTSNTRWFADRLSVVESTARAWERSSRPQELLLTGDVLRDGQQWAVQHPDLVGDVEESFLLRSAELQARADREKRTNKWLRGLIVTAAVVTAFALLALAATFWQLRRAQRAERATERASASFAWNSISQFAPTPRQALLGVLAAADPGSEPPGVMWDQLVQAAAWARSDLAYSNAAALSPDGGELAIANGAEGISVFNVDSGEQVRSLPLQARISDVLFRPDGEALAVAEVTGAGARVTIVDAENGTVDAVLEAEPIEADSVLLVWSRDGSTVAVMDLKDEVVVWDVATGRRIGPSEGQAVGLADDGQQVAVVRGKDLDVVDREGELIQSVSETPAFSAVAPVFAPDGATVFAPLDDGRSMKLNLSDGSKQFSVQASQGSAVLGQGIAEDGTLYWLDSDCRVEGVAPPYEEILTWQLACEEQFATGSPFSGDGRRAMGWADESFKVWDVESGDELFSHATKPTAAASTGPQVVVATAGWVTMRGPDGAMVWRQRLSSEPIRHVAVSTGGEYVAAATDEGVAVADAASGTILQELPVDAALLSGLAVSPDGRRVVLRFGEGIELWEADGQRPVWSKLDKDLPVESLSFSPDGTTVVAGLRDGTIGIVSASDGALMARSQPVPRPTGSTPQQGTAIQAVTTADDGRIAFGDASGQIFTWDGAEGTRPAKVGDLGDGVVAVDSTANGIAAVSLKALGIWRDDDAGGSTERKYLRGGDYMAVGIQESGQVSTVDWGGFVLVHHPEWEDQLRDAADFASSQGWEPITDDECRQILRQACPSRLES